MNSTTTYTPASRPLPVKFPINVRTRKTTSVLASTANCLDPCSNCATQSVCAIAPLLSKIPLGQRQLLFRPQKITKGQHLYHAGDDLSTMYLIKSGLFKTFLTSEAGDEQVMGFQMPGELLGADGLAHHVHSLSAVALESSTVCAITVSKFEAAAEQVAPNWLLRQVYEEVMRERHILLITGRKYSADARIAYFLLEMSAHNKTRGYSETEFKLSIPHRDIAHYLDMALETVSRVFARLQDHKILSIKRPYITITNLEKLKQLAEVAV